MKNNIWNFLQGYLVRPVTTLLFTFTILVLLLGAASVALTGLLSLFVLSVIKDRVEYITARRYLK